MTLEEAKQLNPGDKILYDGEVWKFRHLGTIGTYPQIKMTKGDRIHWSTFLDQMLPIKKPICKHRSEVVCKETDESLCGTDKCLLTKYIKCAKARWWDGETWIHQPNPSSENHWIRWLMYLPEYRSDHGLPSGAALGLTQGMTVHIHPDNLWAFWDKNKRNLLCEAWLVAEDTTSGQSLWLKSVSGYPVLTMLSHGKSRWEKKFGHPRELQFAATRVIHWLMT